MDLKVQDCRLALSNPPTKIALLMPFLISTSFIQKQRWLHNWNQGHWRPSFIMSWKNIFQFLSGDLQGRLPKICLATFPWLFVFKVLSVKYFMAYHFTGPDGPINNSIFNSYVRSQFRVAHFYIIFIIWQLAITVTADKGTFKIFIYLFNEFRN